MTHPVWEHLLVAAGPHVYLKHGNNQHLLLQVGRALIEWSRGQLQDYHARLPEGEQLSGLVDLLACACRARGDPPAAVATQLLRLVLDSVTAEWGRNLSVAQAGDSSEWPGAAGTAAAVGISMLSTGWCRV
jgi:hypothetical protein